MDIRQLEAFLAVVDHGSFSAAAKALFTVQSNVSTHVAHLEEEVGAVLLDRRARTLTPAGRAVEARARAALHEIASIVDEVAALEDRVIGSVGCGTTPSVGLWLLPPVLVETTHRFPEIAVTVVEAQSDELVQRIIDRDLDLAITTHLRAPQLVFTPLFDEAIIAVLADDHPLADDETLTLGQLGTETLLLPLRDNPLYSHIEEGFRRADVALRAGLEVGSSALVTAMAAAGLGVALVPATTVSPVPDLAAAIRPVADLAPREVTLTTRAHREPAVAVGAVAEILTRTARQAAAKMPGCRVRPVSNLDDSC